MDVLTNLWSGNIVMIKTKLGRGILSLLRDVWNNIFYK